MLDTVKVASLKVFGDRRSEVESKVGKKVMQICSAKLFDKSKALHCSVDWADDESSATFCAIINVFYVFDEEDIEKVHCDICRETHNLFYCNRQYNCNQCSFAAYKYRKQEKYKEMKRAGRYVLNRDK